MKAFARHVLVAFRSAAPSASDAGAVMAHGPEHLRFQDSDFIKEEHPMLKTLMVLATSALLTAVVHAQDCSYSNGEDRWSIKTTVTAGALNDSPQGLELQSMIDSANPALSPTQKAALATRRWAGRAVFSDDAGDDVSLKEGNMVIVDGFLYRARCQKDGDYHLEIGVAPTAKGSPCLIVEAPDPKEIDDADLKALVVQVREQLGTLPKGIFTGKAAPVAVTVTGQLFLDVHHIGKGDPGGGRGTNHCATNAWEIHPITEIKFAPN